MIEDRLGIELTPAEIEVLAAERSPFSASMFHGNRTSTMATLLGNHTKVTWTSGNHTSDHVLVRAVGPGAEQFAGLTQNTKVFDRFLAHKEIRHSNPTMTFEKAKLHYDKLKLDGERHEHADLA